MSAALAAATVKPDGSLALNFKAPSPEAYPISSASYLMFYGGGTEPGPGHRPPAFRRLGAHRRAGAGRRPGLRPTPRTGPGGGPRGGEALSSTVDTAPAATEGDGIGPGQPRRPGRRHRVPVPDHRGGRHRRRRAPRHDRLPAGAGLAGGAHRRRRLPDRTRVVPRRHAGPVRDRRPAVGHADLQHPGPGGGGARGPRLRPVRHRVRPAGGGPVDRLPGRRAGRRAQRGLRPVGPAVPRPPHGAGPAVPGRPPGLPARSSGTPTTSTASRCSPPPWCWR